MQLKKRKHNGKFFQLNLCHGRIQVCLYICHDSVVRTETIIKNEAEMKVFGDAEKGLKITRFFFCHDSNFSVFTLS